MDGELILFPDYQELKNTVKKLRTELSMLVLERDELKYVVCRNLETEYMLKLGALEHRVYKAQCEALRQKRKMEMIQALLNRQECVNPVLIERQLDREFAEYQKKLDDQVKRMNAAIERSHLDKLTDEETRELKKLYRAVVKVLHPDLNPSASEEEVRLFEKAVEAYQNGDLQTMRIISEMVGDHRTPDDGVDAMKRLEEERERLVKHIRSVQEDIARIKSRYPYTMMVLLSDEKKIATKKAELEVLLARYEEMGEAYREKISQMLR